MKAENTIKQDFLRSIRQLADGEDEIIAEQYRKAFCFEVVSGCNRHANA